MKNFTLDNPQKIDRWKSPVYTNQKFFSLFKLHPTYKLIPYDHIIDENYDVYFSNKKHIKFTKKENVTLDQYIETIIHAIVNSVKGKNCLIAETSGLDCNVIIAVMNYFSIDYQLYSYNGDRTNYPQWYEHIQNLHWGFNQTPYFDQPTNLVTGMYGDEYILRNPFYVEQHLKIDIIKVFEKYPNAYMFNFFTNSYKKKMNKGWYDWLQWCLNDYQLWSFHKINVINPYKNKEILFQGLSLDQDTILKQLTDGYISKKIIKMMDPNRLENLDKYKNTSDDRRLYASYN